MSLLHLVFTFGRTLLSFPVAICCYMKQTSWLQTHFSTRKENESLDPASDYDPKLEDSLRLLLYLKCKIYTDPFLIAHSV